MQCFAPLAHGAKAVGRTCQMELLWHPCLTYAEGTSLQHVQTYKVLSRAESEISEAQLISCDFVLTSD